MKYINFIYDLLNHLSIRQLLVYCVNGCMVLILIMASASFFANKLINDSQNILTNIAIPIESNSRHIIKTMSDLISRIERIIASDTLEEINHYSNRYIYEDSFDKSYDELSRLVENDREAKNILSEIKTDYDNLLLYDKKITTYQISILSNKVLLNRQADILNNIIEDSQTIIEKVSGIIALQSSYARSELRENIDTKKLNNGNYNRFINNSLLNIESKIKDPANLINQYLRTISQSSIKAINETNKDILVSLKDNEIIEHLDIVKSASITLKNNLTAYPALKIEIIELDNLISRLAQILLYQKSSVFNLRFKILVDNENLTKNVKLAYNSVQPLTNHLEQLTMYVNKLTRIKILDIHQINQYVLIIIAVVSFITFIIALIVTLFLIRRINTPLHKISQAMHALSKGELDTRLEENSFANDEFMTLSIDFNQFASSNQNSIKELSDAKNALEESESRTKAILENALVGIAHLKNRRFISVNQKFEGLFGYDRDEIQGEFTKIIFPSVKEYEDVGAEAYTLLKNGHVYKDELRLKTKDGTIFWCAISAKSLIKGDPEYGTIWLYEDITQQINANEKLRKLANYDTLTELPNRSLLIDRMEQNLVHMNRDQESFALLFIDLDRFKQVNDSFGHAAGDKLLQNVAKRIKNCVRESDTVARLGGDEFTVLLNNLKGGTEICAKIASNIIKSISQPITVNEQEISISPSIGISIFPNDGQDVSSLLQNADAAMYHAKSEGRNNYQYYTEAMNSESLRRLTIENKLRKATEKNEFMVYYQPKIRINDNKLIGYEALIRWHDDESMVPPDEFIPILEETGLINKVGKYIIEQACIDISKLNSKLSEKVSVSVNLSARQFHHNDLILQIKNVIENTGIDPALLELEITETVMMTNSELSRTILNELSTMGIKISLDDFGTGFSSLAYLRKFPINILKIDRTFIKNIHSNTNNATICEAIIAMAHRLGIVVIAEGVETEEQLSFISKHDCDIAQGHLFGLPAPIQTYYEKGTALRSVK